MGLSWEEFADRLGVFVVSYGIDNIPFVADAIADGTEIVTTITWTIEVKDKGGNKGSFPAQPLTIDNRSPELSNAFTGDWWAPNQPEGQRLRGARAGLPGKDKRTSIRAVFDRPMDGASFQTTDFDVTTGGGLVAFKPSKVDFFTGLPDSAFLTVPELAPGATPKLEIVGTVVDKGGNILDITDPLAAVIEQITDGIAPKLDATIVDPLTTADIVMLVTADEPIIGSLPGRTVNRCTDSLTTCTGAAAFTTSSQIIVPQRGMEVRPERLRHRAVQCGTIRPGLQRQRRHCGHGYGRSDGAGRHQLPDRQQFAGSHQYPAARRRRRRVHQSVHNNHRLVLRGSRIFRRFLLPRGPHEGGP